MSFLPLSSTSIDTALYRSTRTDQLIRMEAAKKGTTSDNSGRLIPCLQCNLSLCCSQAHWEAARALHYGPCENAHEGLSHCEMNREVRADIKFEDAMAGTHDSSGQFVWGSVSSQAGSR